MAKIDNGNIYKSDIAAVPAIYLREEDTKTFDIVIEWMYRRNLQALPDRSDQIVHRCLALYGVALRHNIEALQNDVIDKILQHLNAASYLNGERLFKRVMYFDHYHHDDKIRTLLCSYTAYWIHRYPAKYVEVQEANQELMGRVFGRADMIKEIMLMKHKSPQDPTRGKKCDYHKYERTGVCGQRPAYE